MHEVVAEIVVRMHDEINYLCDTVPPSWPGWLPIRGRNVTYSRLLCLTGIKLHCEIVRTYQGMPVVLLATSAGA